MKTGTARFWMMGLTVVGKPAASVITSSPAFSWRSPNVGEVSTETASRFAEDPEFTRRADRTPKRRANLRSNSSEKRPAVSQKSSEESTRDFTSLSSKTLPETGTGLSPAMNFFWEGNASRAYSEKRLRICLRSSSARFIGFLNARSEEHTSELQSL